MSETAISRRKLLKAGAAAGLGLATTPFWTKTIYAQTKPLEHITVLQPSAKSFLWAPADYAQALGLFEKYGVKVEAIGSGKGVNITGVITGDIDVGLGDPTETMNVRQQGQPVKIFGLMHNRYTSHVLVKQKFLDAAGITDSSTDEEKGAVLKGLRMGHSGAGSGPDMLIRYCADLGGVKPDSEMQLISINGGGPAMIAAIQNDQIDGFAWGAPFANVAIAHDGCGYLFEMQTHPTKLFDGLKSTAMQSGEKTLANRKEAMIGYAAGMAASFKAIQDDLPKYKEWLRGFLGDFVPADVFDPAWNDNYMMYAKDPTPVPEAFPKFVEFLNISNKTRGLPPVTAIPYEELVDPTIAAAAMKLI